MSEVHVLPHYLCLPVTSRSIRCFRSDALNDALDLSAKDNNGKQFVEESCAFQCQRLHH